MAKLPWKWTENDLLKMKGDQAEESLTLDFKDSASLGNTDIKKNGISKDVSAFANSSGGVIVYGVSEAGNPPSRFGDIDAGIDTSVVSPEWLEQVINSRIQPRVDGVVIKPIDLKTTHPGRYVYAVYIPASSNAPHQASDHRYYKRYNLQSVPMEDYEVRDVRNRLVAPSVEVIITGKNRTPASGRDQRGKAHLSLSIVLKNAGRRIAQQVYFECDFPTRYFYGSVVRVEGRNEDFRIAGELYRQLRYHHRDNAGSLPLFPGTDCEVLDGNYRFVSLEITSNQVNDLGKSFIFWRVYADGAQPKSGSVSIGELFR